MVSLSDNTCIAVIGLGYVGLPLAVEFSKKYRTIGFDTNSRRISELQDGIDVTQEINLEEMREARRLLLSYDVEDLRHASILIVSVPTPIDEHKQPDLTPLRNAAETVGRVLKQGGTVVFESTVYPGATEEFCVPIIARISGLEYNVDFFAGYSPERINPGDKSHRLTNIVKVTSGSNAETAALVDALYASIIEAGTHKAPSIKVAEAAKVIENTQRDLNIALMNELSIIFGHLNIDTEEVLQAAGTKWNFLPFRPGLVGGHCIGVDPYYLTYKAQSLGYHPEVILAGRRINDGMGSYVAGRLVKQMIKRRMQVDGARVLVLGMTFKENCPDLRNTKVIDIVRSLQDYNVQVDVHDPWIDNRRATEEYGIQPVSDPPAAHYDAIVLAVAHEKFCRMGVDAIHQYGKPEHVLYDLKHVLSRHSSDIRL